MTVHGIVVSVVPAKHGSDVTIVKVDGYIDATTAGELESALYALLKRGICKIVVDLSGVTYISSAGWGIFVGEIKGVRDRGGDIKLAGMVGDVYEVFQLLEFQTILEAYPSAAEAADAFANRTSNRA